MISCRTLGPLQVTVDGARAPKKLMWRRNIALLLYLARAPARRCTRDHAIGLFWADKDDGAAHQSLREATSTLRRYLGDDLRTPEDQLELATGAVELDTEQFDGAGRELQGPAPRPSSEVSSPRASKCPRHRRSRTGCSSSGDTGIAA